MLDGLYRALGSVIAFFYNLIPNYGVAIILLTIFVRVILLPLTIKQTKSMQAMQKIQPHMKELQAKHKGDKQKLNEEMMKLYKTNKVNPLGGCLPLVLQFPVFIALFRVLNSCGVTIAKGAKGAAKVCPKGQIGTKYLPANSSILAAIHSGHTGFLGMNMAATPREVLAQSGVVGAVPYLLLLALMGLTTWYQTKQAASAQPPGAGNQMAVIGKIMPVMLMFFSFQFPAGVSIYWVVSNLWTIGQQRILLGKIKPSAPPAPPKGGKGGGGTPPKAGPKGTEPRGEAAKTGKAKDAGALPESRPKASSGSGGANGGGTKPKPKPQGGDGSAKAEGGGAPRSSKTGSGNGGNPQRRPAGSQARKKRRR